MEKRSNDSFFDGHWLREATNSEMYFYEAQLYGQFSLCYKLHLKSKSPLKDDDVRSALAHLYRKCPSLNFCFGERDGVMWVRRSMNPEVDFEVIKDKDIDEVRKDVHAHKYRIQTGPLFCARLLNNETVSAEFPDDLEPHLLHNYCILIGLHHGVGDGTTNAYIMRFFISLLNDVVAGKSINDDEPLGKIAGTEYFEEELENLRGLLRSDPVLKARLSEEMESFESNLSFIKTAFPPTKGEREPRNVEYIFDQDTTSKFIKRCREECVSVNSAFNAFANVALTDLLLENGIKGPAFTIKTYTAVNLRRYSKTKITSGLGIHFGYPFSASSDVPGKLEGQCWDYARSVHEQLTSYIKTGKPLLNQAFATLSSQDMSASYFLDESKVTHSDFAIGNMGNLTDILSGEGDEVKIIHVIRTVTLHRTDTCPISILCHTFRGKFTMALNYNTFVVGDDAANRFCKQIVKRIRDAV